MSEKVTNFTISTPTEGADQTSPGLVRWTHDDMEEKKLFLLDAYALIYRAYYALIRAPRVTSSGVNTSAIFGFCNTLDEVLRKEDPQYIAVCFDPPGGHTFRHEAYPEYKAQREKQPEDITIAVPYIKEILKAYNIAVVEVADFEADDVIGTLAHRASDEGYTTYMMTPDKDYGQLVTDNVFMYRPALKGQGFEVRGPKEVCEKYGLSSPRQVIDLLALEGDASDNVPGCPGVGEKTAVKLINEWGSVENLLDNAHKLKGALGNKVRDNAEQIRFSKFLVTIRTDVPVDISLQSLRRKEPDFDRLLEIYKELEFRTFIARLTARNIIEQNTSAASSQISEGTMGSLFDVDDASAQVASQSVNFTEFDTGMMSVADTPEKISETVRGALTHQKVGVHLAAAGEEAMTARLYGMAIAYGEDSNVYVPLPEAQDQRQRVFELLQPLFDSGSVMIVSHDIKRDMILLRRENVALSAPYFDNAVAHYILKPEMKHNVEFVASDMAGYKMIAYALTDIERRKLEAGPTETSGLRSAEKARVALMLQPLLARAVEEQGQTDLLNNIEMPFVEVLASMEWEGARIDVEELRKISENLTSRLKELERSAYELAGGEFNISSPTQVGEILFGKMQIDPKAKKTKTGAWSTTEEILEKFRKDYEIVDIILKVRGTKKLLSTYVDALPKLINPVTGKLHTSYNQTVTATGRISSTNPNLQNIPIRTDDGREIRRAFIPDDGCLMLSADYSQIELRLMADFSGDTDMVEAFNSGKDFHRATAAKIYHIPIDDVTDDQRRNAKTANFGIIYGISTFGLSQRLDIPRTEAKMLIDGYMASYPGVRRYMDESIEKARSQGYVSTIMGRKRYLPDINSRNATVRGYAERNAINAPLQGSAADIIKKAMIRIYHDINDSGLKSKMIMQVHDELIFNVVPSELPRLQEIVTRDMEDAFFGKVRLEVSCGVGSNWLEAH